MENDGSLVTILFSSFWVIVIGIWVFKAMSSESPPTTPKPKEKTRYVRELAEEGFTENDTQSFRYACSS